MIIDPKGGLEISHMKDGKAHGHSIEISKNGKLATGLWLEGKRDGPWKITAHNGSKVTDFWKNGE